MVKSNTNSEKIIDNTNKNIKTIEKLPQIKISYLSTILYLLHCSKFIIRQYLNLKSYKCTLKHWKRMIKGQHKQNVLFLQNTVDETHIPNVRFTKFARIFICCTELYFCLNIPSEFMFLVSLGINCYILGASEDMLSVPKYTLLFLRL